MSVTEAGFADARAVTSSLRPRSTLPSRALPLAMFLGCVAFFCIGLGRGPHPDELHHVLAARSMAAGGPPAIADGIYTRGLAYTWLVARSFEVFGVGIAASRVPSILFMAALATFLFVWLRREAGEPAAWIGGILFMLSPFTVEVAQFSRFYAPQALAFFVAVALIYRIAGTPSREHRRWPLLLGAGSWLAIALYLQVTTVFGIVAILAWLSWAVVVPRLKGAGVARSRFVTLGLATSVLGAIALALLWDAGLLAAAWYEYRYVPTFAQSTRDDVGFYFKQYIILYPVLWLATPLLVTAAGRRWPGPTTLAISVFVVSFVLASFGGYKGMRYIAFAQPFLFAVWGMGLAALLASSAVPVARLRRRLGASGLLALLLVAVAVNPFWVRSAALMADVTLPGEQPNPDWELARPALVPRLAEADVVVSTEELGTLYYLGRYDVRFSPSKLGELTPDQRHEFGIDHRTGRAVIATPDSLDLVIGCYASGIIVGPSEGWGRQRFVDGGVIAVIERGARRIELPPEANLFAFDWRRTTPLRPDAECRMVRDALHTAG